MNTKHPKMIDKLDKLNKSLNRYIALSAKSKVAWLLVEIERLRSLIEKGSKKLIVGNDCYAVYYHPDNTSYERFSLVRLSDNAEGFFDSESKAIQAWFSLSEQSNILKKTPKPDIYSKLAKKQQSYKSSIPTPAIKTGDQITLLWGDHKINLVATKQFKDGWITLILRKVANFNFVPACSILEIPKAMLETIGHKTFKFYDHITLKQCFIDHLIALIELDNDLIDIKSVNAA